MTFKYTKNLGAKKGYRKNYFENKTKESKMLRYHVTYIIFRAATAKSVYSLSKQTKLAQALS